MATLVASKGNDPNLLRGAGIDDLFFQDELWALEDWKETRENLSQHEIESLEPDIVLRTVRGSHFLKERAKRVERNCGLLKGRVVWHEENDVGTILTREPPLVAELFRTKVLPIKIFGTSADGHPILKFSLKETDWYLAQKEITTDDLLCLVIRTLESMLRSVTDSGCKGKSKNPDVHVQGKYIAVFDLEGLSWGKFRSANSLGLKNMMATCSKFYPETVLKTYLVNSYIVKAVVTVLSPFIPQDTRARIKVCSNVEAFVKDIKEQDNVSDDSIPIEFGGTCEGKYVMNI